MGRIPYQTCVQCNHNKGEFRYIDTVDLNFMYSPISIRSKPKPGHRLPHRTSPNRFSMREPPTVAPLGQFSQHFVSVLAHISYNNSSVWCRQVPKLRECVPPMSPLADAYAVPSERTHVSLVAEANMKSPIWKYGNCDLNPPRIKNPPQN